MSRTKKRHKKGNKSRFRYPWVLLISLITLIVYLPSLNSDFVNWDDETYIEENVLIQDLSKRNIKTMFRPGRYLIGNYHPVTELSFAINYAFSELNPVGYKATNILLHLLNTVLVFFLFYQIGKKNILVAGIVSLLFGIHPMHVESVSWISERKDLLYTFFYLLALISYLHFLTREKRKFYFLAVLLFLLSVLSKAQAVTLPLVLMLIHFWYQKTKLSKITLLLTPFLVISLIFGLIAIQAQDQALTVVDLSWTDRIIVGCYGLITYIIKSCLPHNLCALHPYPQPLVWPTYFWLFPLLGVLLIMVVVNQFNRNRTVFVGLSFFLLTIFPVLQFLPVGMSMHAERYTYLPYLGLFFILATAFDHLRRHKNRKWQLASTGTGLVFLTVLCLLTYQRTQVWKNSETLWKNVIEKYPANFAAYLNLTYFYLVNNKTAPAIAYADKGIREAGHNVYLYDNKSYAYILDKKYAEALEVLEAAQQFVTPDIQFYINKGDACEGLNKHKEAEFNYTKALEIDVNYIPALMRRATVKLDHLKDYQGAAYDLERVLILDPNNVEALRKKAKLTSGIKEEMTK